MIRSRFPFQVFCSWGCVFALAALAVIIQASAVLAEDQVAAADSQPAADEKVSEAGLEFFETHIRPVLIAKCYECHSKGTTNVKGGLLLDTREGIRRGGESGHGIVPGDIDESLVLAAIKYDSFEMPPKQQLDAKVIAKFEQWVRMGAPDPRGGASAVTKEIDVEAGRDFWAFQPLAHAAIPPVKTQALHDWPLQSLDHFVLSELENHDLRPSAAADRETLLRRVTFDLSGLPPSVEEIETFVKDQSPGAYAKVVERLLASPTFGERWGRHWLDVARYGDTTGRTRNIAFRFAWRYRDYVINAFQNDKPYDQFVREQVAGDLLDHSDAAAADEARIATGFLAIGSYDLNENNNEKFSLDVADEQINVIGRGMLAMTLGCARCHDHKFDPIPTEDYYALTGIFRSTELLAGVRNKQGGGNYQFNESLVALKTVANTESEQPSPDAMVKRINKQIADAREQKTLLSKRVKAARNSQNKGKKKKKGPQSPDLKKRAVPAAGLAAMTENLQRLDDRMKQLRKRLSYVKKNGGGSGGPTNLAMGVRDGKKIVDERVRLKGEPTAKGEPVNRGFVQVLCSTGQHDVRPLTTDESGRRELAEWLTDGEAVSGMLTARVMANRVWQHLIGRGIVTTVDNFGNSGAPPANRELLDHLAERFIEQGWSVKQLIREIVLSRTYQMSSEFNELGYAADPDNQRVWRMNQRRLEVEAIRDSILSISGKLQMTSPDTRKTVIGVEGAKNGQLNNGTARAEVSLKSPYRSVYLPVIRDGLPGMFSAFDFAEPSETNGKRDVTTVPTQALFMMNNPLVVQAAQLAATKMLVAPLGRREARIQYVYQQTLGRKATEEEIARFGEYLNGAGERGTPAIRAWGELYQVMMASAEFRYLK